MGRKVTVFGFSPPCGRVLRYGLFSSWAGMFQNTLGDRKNIRSFISGEFRTEEFSSGFTRVSRARLASFTQAEGW